ncbi:FtsX-like permease family protein [Clostridium sp.]|uniref:ABC transporter permease n=1 Tax=Clostridium sp. TaxID=1506 RepID=UPI003216D94D
MNKFIQLVPRYLRKNKKRTFLLCLSIVFSIALINSVYIMVDTLTDKFYDSAVEAGGGRYHGSGMMSFNNILNGSDIIESKGRYVIIGVKNFQDKSTSVELGGYEEETYKLLNMNILEGKYPENQGEIALEKWIKDKIFPDKKVGDAITLRVEEPIYDLAKGTVKETKMHENKFKLVGIMSDSGNHKMIAKGRAAITMEEARKIKSVDDGCTLYFRVNDEENAEREIETLKKENMHAQFKENVDYIRAIKLANTIDKLGAFLIIIVSVGAMAVVYNIFYIMVIERIREFSMIRAVGASKEHIVRLVIGEAIALGIVCIPLGIIIGIGGINGVYRLISSISKEELNIIISEKSIIFSSIIGFITLIVSSLTPAIYGGKVSPIEGMKENYINKIEVNPEKVSSIDKFLNRISGFTGVMAYNNMKKSKKRLLATVVSLTISITLVVATTYLLSIFDVEKQAKKATGGDIYMKVSTFDGLRENYAYDEADIKNISSMKEIKEVKKHKASNVTVAVEESRVTEEGKRYIGNLYAKTNNESKLSKGRYEIWSQMYGVDDSEIEKMDPYLKEGTVNVDEYSNKPGVIIMDDLGYTDYVDMKVGDKIALSIAYQEVQNGEWKHINDVEFEIKATLKAIPIRPIDYLNPVIVIMSNSSMEKYFGIKDYEHININVKKDTDTMQLKQKLMPMAESKNGGGIKTYIEEVESGQDTTLVASLILYGFAGILALIAIINIVNTMSISVILRRREFGTLRAVGMSKGDITSIIIKEGIVYGVLSSIIGCILGGGISYIIYIKLRYILLENELYQLPLNIFIGVTIATILITVLVCIPAIRKTLKYSIVESIKIVE